MNSQKEGSICLALILFMLHLAARTTAKFLTTLPGYLHLNHFFWHYVNLLAELKFSFSLGSCTQWFAPSPALFSSLCSTGFYSRHLKLFMKPQFSQALFGAGYVVFSDLHHKITLPMNSWLGLKENMCLGPMFSQFRGVLIRLYLQSDYSVVFSLLST